VGASRAGRRRSRQCFRAYKKDIGAFVESCVRSRVGAEEVVQDLFLRIWAQREQPQVGLLDRLDLVA
jgi:DNA-directed RNA polymerase specialized sigma24 family protein